MMATTTYRLALPWSRPPLTENSRLHHFPKAKLIREIRETGGWLVKQAKIPPVGFCEVTLVWVPSCARNRDDDNPTPTIKALADGIVDAGIVPDDSTKHMRRNPTVIDEPSKNPGMWLIIETTARTDTDLS